MGFGEVLKRPSRHGRVCVCGRVRTCVLCVCIHISFTVTHINFRFSVDLSKDVTENICQCSLFSRKPVSEIILCCNKRDQVDRVALGRIHSWLASCPYSFISTLSLIFLYIYEPVIKV